MIPAVIDFLLSILEGMVGGWWGRYKQRKAQNAQNDVGLMPDDVIDRRLRDEWTRR